MIFFKVTMKEAGLLVLLVMTLICPCVGASPIDQQEQKDVVASLELIYLENDALHLTWNLLNSTGAVRGFSLTWNDGASDKHAHESRTEATIDYPSNLDCSDKLTVTVIPLNDDNVHIGTKWTTNFDLNDMVTNIVLTPEENMISAFWSIKCQSQVHTETVVIWEGVSHSQEASCRFPSTARDTTDYDVCPAEKLVLRPGQLYYVYIEPLDKESSYTGIAGRRRSSTLEEGCHKSAAPTKSTCTHTKDLTLSSTEKITTVNVDTSTHRIEVSNPGEPPTEKKWLTVGAAAFSIVLVVILVFIILKWRTACKDGKKFIGLPCTKIQAEEPTVRSPMAPLQEQHTLEMRTVQATRTSLTESLGGHTYCYPNITPRVREEIAGIVCRDDNGLLVEEEETSPLYPPRNTVNMAVEANAGTSNNGDHIILQGKTVKVLEAVKLLASLRIRESSELAREESEVATREFSEPQAEKLEEAIRLLDELMSMSGKLNDFSEIVGRPPSTTNSLVGHGYCYPNFSREVINQILSDAKIQQHDKKKRRRK